MGSLLRKGKPWFPFDSKTTPEVLLPETELQNDLNE